MKYFFRQTLFLLALAVGIVVSSAEAQVDVTRLAAPLPTDPNVRVGKLDNGLTYLIRQNSKPENFAELRLAVRAGSILEDDDQLGLAHFVEHMAFNGTDNFEENEMISFLESIGMAFGADLNAFTSFNETVYFLKIPTDRDDALETGFLILHDWAGGILFEEEDIDAERGVIVEEKRSRESGDSRVGLANFSAMYEGMRYPDRLPIGELHVIENAPYEAFRRFYRDWYRPDLMAIVAVGDFDPDEVEEMIREQFGKLEMPANPKPRPTYELTPFEGTRFGISFDPEATSASVGVQYMLGTVSRDRVGDYRRSILDGLVSSMLSDRMIEFVRTPQSPLVTASGGAGLGQANSRQFSVGGQVKGTRYLESLEALLVEVERMRQHGFTTSEFERAKDRYMTNIDQAYAERDKTESSRYAREYFSHFTRDESFPGIETERQMTQDILAALSLDEINRHAAAMVVENGRGVTIGGPENDDTPTISESDIRQVFDAVESRTIEPYAEEAIASSLMSGRPTPGAIIDRKRIAELGVTEWTLSNHVKVVLKPTTFKNDEIYMTAFSPGGTSLVTDDDYISGQNAAGVVAEGGLGPFNVTKLRKFLAGKNVSVSAGIEDHHETLGGSTTIDDLRTFFEMIHLRFTEPRKDPEAFDVFRQRLTAGLENAGSNPQRVFFDTVGHVLGGYHPRTRPMTTAMVDEIDLDDAFTIYLDRFADAGDFTFVFVGSFDLETMEEYVTTYIASLPTGDRKEMWRDEGIEAPKGKLKKVVESGTTDKSLVALVYRGPYDPTYENRMQLRAMTDVLQRKIRESLREGKGGVYSPSVFSQTRHEPNGRYSVIIFFACDPERADELITESERIVDEMRSAPVSDDYIGKVVEIMREQRQESIETNGFWLSNLDYLYRTEGSAMTILEFDSVVEKISAKTVHESARTFLQPDERKLFVLRPEN